jgi:DNA-directed RNA polymerase II subunit RPB9
MSTPRSTTSYDGASSGPKKYEEIKFTFCPECSNLLYPKEHDKAAKLTYLCRTCQYQVEADQSCVFRNILNSSSGETAGVTQDVGSDPTVSEAPAVLCLYCGTCITCTLCGVAHPEVACEAVVAKTAEPGHEGHVIEFAPWDDEYDPYAEYDEESMDDTFAESADQSYVSDVDSYTNMSDHAFSDAGSTTDFSKRPAADVSL